jgi:AAA15 family ATPase/GTPase
VEKPVSFEIELVGEDGYHYIYKISFTAQAVQKEELSFYPGKKQSLLFKRIRGNPMKYGEYYKGDKKYIEQQLLENQLFLSKAANSNVEQLKSLYLYFKEKIHVIPFVYGRRDHQLRQLYAERFATEKDSDFKQRFNKLISILDTGIDQLTVEKTDPDAFQFPENFPSELKEKILRDPPYDIKAKHGVYKGEKRTSNTYFDITEESDGTQRLFVLAGLVLDALEDGTLLVVDEFERSLHPHIIKYLIKLFHNPKINTKNAQLLFATHDITQLDHDIFRRDQIWFTQKDPSGATALYSLGDFQGVRRDVPFDKWYYSGRFDATPLIDELEFELNYGEG